MKANLLITFALVQLAGCGSREHEQAIADPDATAETAALHRYLLDIASKGIMFGHQDDTVYGVEWYHEEGRSDVLELCGDYPAVYGWEIGGLELGNESNLDDVPFDMMREHIIRAYGLGGINTISWHLHNPETGGNSWDCKTTTAVASILPGGGNHPLYRGWLDSVADFMLSLKAPSGEHVPVIWRPLHEHTHGGFWWGSDQCTPEEFAALWRFSLEYLRDTKQVHNLLYCYSPDVIHSREHYLERWPGDEYVDVLGLDAYHRPGEWDYITGVAKMLETVSQIAAEKGKPAAFTETGLEAIPDPRWWTGTLLPAIGSAPVSYVLVWRNAYQRPDHWFGPWKGSVSAGDFIEFLNNDTKKILMQKYIDNPYN